MIHPAPNVPRVVRTTCRRLRAAAAVLLSAVPASVLSAPLDFDGDGRSELVSVEPLPDGTLRWTATAASGGVPLPLGDFGRIGDHLAVAEWEAPGVSALGIIGRPVVDSIVWTVRTAAGDVSFPLGGGAATVIAGGDFDGDGVADAAVAERDGARLRWSVKLAPLRAPGAAPVVTTFGRSKDVPFFLRDGTSASLAVASVSGGRTVVSFRKLNGRAVKRIRVPTRSDDRPFPVRLAGGGDAVAFVDRGDDRTTVRLYDARGRRVSTVSLPGRGTLVVGDYTDSPGEEVGLSAGPAAPLTLVNPRVRRASAGASAVIPVDAINLNTFPRPDGAPADPAECAEQDPTDGPGGYLWKPVSDTQRFAVTVLPPVYTGRATSVSVLTEGGALVNVLSYKGIGNGDRSHWQDRGRTGADYEREFGGVVVRAELDDGSCLVYRIRRPSVRTD